MNDMLMWITLCEVSILNYAYGLVISYYSYLDTILHTLINFGVLKVFSIGIIHLGIKYPFPYL
jgi:hypothetical protein